MLHTCTHIRITHTFTYTYTCTYTYVTYMHTYRNSIQGTHTFTYTYTCTYTYVTYMHTHQNSIQGHLLPSSMQIPCSYLYVYAGIYKRVYAYDSNQHVRVCTLIWAHVCIHVRVYMRFSVKDSAIHNIYIYIYIYIQLHTYIHMHVCMRASAFTDMKHMHSQIDIHMLTSVNMEIWNMRMHIWTDIFDCIIIHAYMHKAAVAAYTWPS